MVFSLPQFVNCFIVKTIFIACFLPVVFGNGQTAGIFCRWCDWINWPETFTVCGGETVFLGIMCRQLLSNQIAIIASDSLLLIVFKETLLVSKNCHCESFGIIWWKLYIPHKARISTCLCMITFYFFYSLSLPVPVSVQVNSMPAFSTHCKHHFLAVTSTLPIN